MNKISVKKILSIVIPAYNRKAELKSLLESLVPQKYSKSEVDITVVDDGSSDGTETMVKTFFNRGVKYIRQENSGPAKARNNGYKNSSGKFLGFLDSDVIADKNYIKNAIAYLKKNTNIGCVEGRTLPSVGSVKPSYFTHSVENTTGGRYLTCNIIYSRIVMDNTGGFDERYPDPIREDTDLGFAAITAGAKFVYAKNITVYHPVYKSSYKMLFKLARQAIFEPLLFKKFPGLYFQKLKWLDGWFMPVYYLGYYALPVLAAFYPFTKDFFWPVLGMLLYLFSYVVTVYAQLRKKVFTFGDFSAVCFFFIFIPYVRLFWLVVGLIKYASVREYMVTK